MFAPEIVISDSPVTPAQSSEDNSTTESSPDDTPSANVNADSETLDAEPTIETPDSSDTSPTVRSYPSRARNPMNQYESTW